MIGTEVQSNTDIYYFITGYYTFFHCINDAFFNSRDKSSRNNATYYGIDEFKAFTSWQGFHFEMDMSILSSTAGLFLMFIFNIINTTFYCFAERNLWFDEININAVTFFQSFNRERQLEFTLTGYNSL